MKSRGRKPKLGSGTRFRNLSSTLAKKYGPEKAKAIAASIGRKKYGAKRFGNLSKRGRN